MTPVMSSPAVVAAASAANEQSKPYRHRTKVGMISLGCAKNLVDAEIMLGSVLERGMEITSRIPRINVLILPELRKCKAVLIKMVTALPMQKMPVRKPRDLLSSRVAPTVMVIKSLTK